MISSSKIKLNLPKEKVMYKNKISPKIIWFFQIKRINFLKIHEKSGFEFLKGFWKFEIISDREESLKQFSIPFFLQCELVPINMPNNVTSSCLSVLNARKDVKKIAILIHGYLNSFPTLWLHEMQASIQSLENDTAVIVRPTVVL